LRLAEPEVLHVIGPPVRCAMMGYDSEIQELMKVRWLLARAVSVFEYVVGEAI